MRSCLSPIQDRSASRYSYGRGGRSRGLFALPQGGKENDCLGIVFRSKTEQKVADAGYDPARLPPGQYLTEKWPVLHAGSIPRFDPGQWDFKIWGLVEQPVRLTYPEFVGLPATGVTIDIHCVTRWSSFDTRFRGVH